MANRFAAVAIRWPNVTRLVAPQYFPGMRHSSPPRTLALALAMLYAMVTIGTFVGTSPDDRIGGLLFLFLLLFGLLAGAVVRFRALPMAILLWILAAAQTLVLIALLAAHVGNPGVVAFVNVLVIGGMVFVATQYGRSGPKAGTPD